MTQRKARTVAVVAGYWSTNIGNSFFQLGAEYLLHRVFPDDRVIMVSDQPGYWNTRRGSPSNALPLLEHLSLDYLVILGPFLRPEYDRIWLPTLRKLYATGTKVIVLSAGMMDYSQSTVRQCRDWLAETPPNIFTTRDEETFTNFADLAEHSYDGIDVAFFIADVFEPISMNLKDFVVLNFDKIPEPSIWISNEQDNNIEPDQLFEFQGERWKIAFPKLRTVLSRKLKLYSFIDTFWPGAYPEQIGNLLIVRTDHRFNPLFVRKIFRGPNSFASDIPHSYLTLYANSTLTLSNRVHACVASLAYGKPAMLFSRTPRVRLLQRVGLDRITEQPQQVDLGRLAEEKARLIGFLRSVIEAN